MPASDLSYLKSSGLLYIVLDKERILRECEFSVRSFKKYCPDIPVQLITNFKKEKINSSLFDYIDVTDKKINPFKGKVFHMQRSRFDRTLFIDADTEFRQPV